MRINIVTLCIACMISVLILSSCGRSKQSEENPDNRIPPTVQAPTISPTVDNQDTSKTSIDSFIPVLEIHENQNQGAGTHDVKKFDATLENGDTAQFEIDSATDEVVGFVRLGRSASAVNVDTNSSLQIASTFLTEHGISPEVLKLQLVNSGLYTDGPAKSNYYTYWWVQTDPNSGALLPNEIKLRVNAETGQVDSYSRMQVDVTAETVPDISEEQAKNIALGVLDNLDEAEIATIVLTVSTLPVYEPDGEQTLMWQIVIEGAPDDTGYVPGAFLVIDAISGEIVHIEPFM